MKYVWQKYNASNRNHYICEVKDTINPHDSPIVSRYFDGTQSAALKHFIADKQIKRYMAKQGDRYSVFMRGNSIQLNWIDDSK